MKTAEELYQVLKFEADKQGLTIVSADAIRHIQSDCLREAAEIANQQIRHDSTYPTDKFTNLAITGIRDAILAKAKEMSRNS